MQTVGEKLDARRGMGPGFDFLRVALAVGIVVWHSFGVARNPVWGDGTQFAWIFGYGMLVMFFSLSGFLISGSAQRLKLHDFLINRGLRIFPALGVEIALSALVLGPIFTTLTLEEYFRNPGTFSYFTNIVGKMNFYLPSVFLSNPVSVVNWSLWTVPHEFVCYAIMSGLMITRLLRRPAVVLITIILIIAAGFIGEAGAFKSLGFPGRILDFLLVGRGSRLYVGFLLGIAMYLYRHRIPYSKVLFALAVGLCVLIAYLGPAKWMSYPTLACILALPLAYITAFLGATELPTLPIFHRGDYSYGVYLYGMPVQQTMVALFPSVRDPLLQLGLALPAIILFSMFSWHVIEKPVLAVRKRFSFVARVRGVEGVDASNVGAPAVGPDGVVPPLGRKE